MIPVARNVWQQVEGDSPAVAARRLIDPDRWRAYLVGVPGGPTALMPFYGETPELAVERLADWLALA